MNVEKTYNIDVLVIGAGYPLNTCIGGLFEEFVERLYTMENAKWDTIM